MAVIPEITCRRCGSKYSGLHSRCPKCGAPRVNQPTRVPPTTASVTPRTAASARSAINIRWQFVFGGVLLLALVLAVVVLVRSGGSRNSAGNAGGNTGNPGNAGDSNISSYISADLPTPSATPEPTPATSPTPEIQSLDIIWTATNKTPANHEMQLTNPGEIFDIDLDVVMYPAVENAVVEWTSSNEKILTVNERGFVNVVGASPDRTVHALITASYGGLQSSVMIYVPPIQAQYLTENLYDKDTYDADNLEVDTRWWASPSPSAGT